MGDFPFSIKLGFQDINHSMLFGL